jgi:voltage-gated potassium channel
MAIENYRFIEALYMTVITMTTIGFMEVRPLHDAGRVFTIFIAFSGGGLLLMYIGILTQFVMEGQVSRLFGRRKVVNAVKRLKNHYILCGAGRIGSLIAKELTREKVPFVVIERDHEKTEELVEQNVLAIRGNAIDEEVLQLAQVEKAKGLVMALASDADTVYAILTARQINPDLYIIARANDVGAAKKLKMAGANRVVSPYEQVSSRMVHAIVRPEVVDMLEMAFLDDELNLGMEGIPVSENCTFDGKTLLEANLRANFAVTIVGIKKSNGKTVLGPGPNDQINCGDVLIVAGRRTDVDELAKTMGA